MLAYPVLASVNVTAVPSQTDVASAEKSAFNETYEAQSSKKIVCESILVQLVVAQAASSTEMQFRLEFPVASKFVKFILFPFLTSKLFSKLELQSI